MKFKNLIHALALILMLMSVSALVNVQAQKRGAESRKPQPEVDSLKGFREDFIKASEDYKASLQKLLEIYEGDVTKVNDRAAKWKELYTDGLISRIEYEATAGEITAAQVRVDDVRKQIAKAEITIAEARKGPQPN